VKVVLVKDLSSLTTDSIQSEAKNLLEVWDDNENAVFTEDMQVDIIINALDDTRDEIKRVLKSLD